jgi:hypothetical protein
MLQINNEQQLATCLLHNKYNSPSHAIILKDKEKNARQIWNSK